MNLVSNKPNDNIIASTASGNTQRAEATATNSVMTTNPDAQYDSSSYETPVAETSALDKALEKVIGKDYAKIKEELKQILDKLGIKLPESKTELTEEEIQKITEKVQKLVDSLKAQNLEINAENLFKAACYAIDTKILQDAGMTREEYEEAVKNGEAKSLRELLGLQEGEEITEEKIIAFAKKLIEESQARIKNSPNPAEALKEEIAAQKRQFALCLVSTSPEDRAKLFSVIEHAAYSENRAEFINNIFASISPEDRIKLANQFGWDKINKILSTPDANGNTCTIDKKTGAIVTISKYQKANVIRANQEKFMVQARSFFAREDVIAVLNKIKNGEELTPEEQNIANEIETYTAYSAGTQIGTANSMVLSDESRNELVKLLHHDSYELPNYRDVLGEINSFVENDENAEYLTMSKKEFTQLIDKVSNGNYSIVNTPKDPNASSNADLGYTNTGSVDTERVNTLIAQILAQSEPENTAFVIDKDAPSEKEPVSKGKLWTRSDIAKDPLGFFKSGIKYMSDIDLAYAFSKLPTTIQTIALEVTGGKAFNLFFDEASDRVILETKRGRTYYQSEQLAEARQEIEEKTAYA